jgi:hypothetical protein
MTGDLERLAALVPPPRMHTLIYHGLLAPGSSWRSDIVPRREREPRLAAPRSRHRSRGLVLPARELELGAQVRLHEGGQDGEAVLVALAGADPNQAPLSAILAAGPG